jgi:restriction endonuclease S subunit
MRPLREDYDILASFIGALSEKLAHSYPLARLGDIGEYVMRNVAIDPTAEYKQITVAMNNRGLRLRRCCKGSEIQSPGQCSVEAGDILFSRIDLRNGAIGVVGDDLAGAVVTRDFPIFRLFESTHAARRFLGFVFQTQSFKAQAQNASKGTTGRKKMKREQFLEFEVPWPSPAQQERVVRVVERAYSEVAALRRGILAQETGFAALRGAMVATLFARDAGL